ncbi:hypothetical protein HDU92_000139 [Lobulomyces angularis]|nr:hypothetical protein HDU92_000139 [Lobulomyces angularis]
MSEIFRIPEELMIIIFQNLSKGTKRSACQVCRRWKNILYNNPVLWKTLILSNELSLGAEKQISIDEKRRIVNCYPVIDDGVNKIIFQIFVDSIQSRNRFRFLQKLELSYTNVDLEIFCVDEVVETLQDNLTHLYIDGCFNVDSGSLHCLRYLRRLKFLDISHCSNVDDFGLEVLAKILPNLETLNLSYLFRLTEKGIAKLFKLPYLNSVNLLGCYRIRSYPWALSETPQKKKLVICPVKELLLGEDARIQTGGFWLLWCCWNWNMKSLAQTCPFLETLRINMVLFDLPSDGIQTLLSECKNLKHLGLVVDRNSAPALCRNVEMLNKLSSLELTCHIGLTNEQMTSLIKSNCLKKLSALKFHSKHTLVFNDKNLLEFTTANKSSNLEYFEINAENINEKAMSSIVEIGTNIETLSSNTLEKEVDVKTNNFLLPNNKVVEKIDSKFDLENREEILKNSKLFTNFVEDGSKKKIQNSFELKKKKIPKQKENPKILQNLLIHNASLSNESLKKFSSGLKNVRELTLSNLRQINSSNKLSHLVKNTTEKRILAKLKNDSKNFNLFDTTLNKVVSNLVCLNLRKIELSSLNGFSDKDLSSIPENCLKLQWIDFSFSFTFPETLNSITKNCPQLLYLKLSRYNQNSTVSRNFGGLVGAIPRRNPILHQNNAASETNNNEMSNNSTGVTVVEVGTSLAATKKKLQTKNKEFLANSKESRSFINFSKNGTKSLRMLDLSGNLGLSDYVLSEMGKNIKKSLHTLFLENLPALTKKGVKNFGESTWKHLKRINIRDCLKIKFSCVDENFLVKALLIEVIVDGNRVGISNPRSLFVAAESV